MSEPKRLHPIAAVHKVLKSIKELLLPLLLFFVFGSNETTFYFMVAGAMIVIVGITGIVSWLKYSYRLEQQELRIEYGLFVRKKRYIPFDRIQSLDLTSGILHRMFNLVQVKVETAGGSAVGKEADAVLTAVTKQEAERIKSIIFAERSEVAEDLPDKSNVTTIYQITNKQLLLLATTSGSVGVVLSAVMAFFFQFEEVIPYEEIFSGITVWVQGSVLLITFTILFFFTLAWVASIILTYLRYANFTVKKEQEDIIITKGLIEKRQLTLPLVRIQSVRVVENPIRQLLGLAAVYVDSAGSTSNDMNDKALMLFPVIRKRALKELVELGLPDYEVDPPLKGAPVHALKLQILRSFLILLPFLAAGFYFFHKWGLVVLLIVPLLFTWRWFQYKDTGYHLSGNKQLTLRHRAISRTTSFLLKNKIQAIEWNRGPIMRKWELVSVWGHVKSGSTKSIAKVNYITTQDAKQVYQWFRSQNEYK
ncbi:PH domain-containing protein [Bacillus carboniphilus]|uniref:PH domain-containing protein n=1 Tax=Bacillus carboniphilus TaxID=86663 RepID=A0ABN0W0L0_9BACI